MTLRDFSVADADRVLELLGEDGLAMLTPSSLETAYAWINSHSLPSMYIRAVCDQSGSVVGAVGLTIQKNQRNAELSFWIGKEDWGKGLASQAAIEMVRYGFTVLRLHRIFGKHYSNNPASGRVMQKAGMMLEGRWREEAEKENQFYDLLFYSILEHEHPQCP